VSTIDIRIEETLFRVDTTNVFDLSIPLYFNSETPTAFGMLPATARIVENEWFVGDTRRGGSCNVDEYTLIPHCQGTHTECVGHIVDEQIAINEILKDTWIPATVLSLETEEARDCMDHYPFGKTTHDELISKQSVIKALDRLPDKRFQKALIIRTLPNNSSKKQRRYTTAAYFSNDAMEAIASHPTLHLLVDLPSIDCMEDGGKLSNHRIFWKISNKHQKLGDAPASSKTITELIFVPDEVVDGYYLLNLQIPPFMTDAAPSRPLIFPVQTP